MFLQLVLTGIGGIAIILACEALIKLKKVKGEYARKLVHISISIYAASWAYFLPYWMITLISLLLIAGVLIVKQFHLMQSLRPVKRVTNGELYFAAAIGITAALFHEPAIYAIAILHLGLADGFAAIVGVGMSEKKNRFKYRGAVKSIEGTLTFVAVSFFLNVSYWIWLTNHPICNSAPLFIAVYSLICAMVLASLEIASPKGSDNIIIPVATGFFLWVPFALFSSSVLFT